MYSNNGKTERRFLKKLNIGPRWWHMLIIPALRMVRQEDHKLVVRLGYTASPRLACTTVKIISSFKKK